MEEKRPVWLGMDSGDTIGCGGAVRGL